MLIKYEQELYKKGVKYIAGIDEVGRGPLAGPMVMAAVVLDLETIFSSDQHTNNDVLVLENLKQYDQIKDSKKLSEKNRNLLSNFIKQNALGYSIIEISHTELDEKGISDSFQRACFKLLKNLHVRPQHILVDAFEIKKLTLESQTNIIGGDNLSISIAAASIIAKVHRDNIMLDMHKMYPNYRFDLHKGYGTKIHLEAIKIYGPCDIHRKSFEPIKSFIENKKG